MGGDSSTVTCNTGQYKSGYQCYSCFSNCYTCSEGGTISDMRCESCSSNQVRYSQNCYYIYDNTIKSFRDPANSNMITSCKQLFNKYIKENTYQCIDMPSIGYFILNEETGLLSQCDASCNTCSINKTNCDSCKQSGQLKLLQDNKCVKSCSEGYYQSGNNCYKCYKNCKTCSIGAEYNNEGNLINMKCSSCLDNMIQNEENCFPSIIYNETAIIFDTSEINEEKNLSYCFNYNKTIYFEEYKCISKPYNTYFVFNTNDNTGIIKNCSNICNECIGESKLNDTNCINCALDYFKTEDSNTNCLQKDLIPINYYKNISDNIFYKCFPDCFNCTTGYNYLTDNMNCITCKNDYFFIYQNDKKKLLSYDTY